MDVLGLLWHPTIGQWVAIDTFRAAPLWGMFVYAICFGRAAAVLAVHEQFAGRLGSAVLLLVVGSYFRGWRVLGVPVSLDVAGSSLTGRPVFSALHAQASTPVK